MNGGTPGRRITLDRFVTYRIVVSGRVEGDLSDWAGERLTIDAKPDEITVVTGRFDQAALHGFLRRLYSLGFPLISLAVLWTSDTQEDV